MITRLTLVAVVTLTVAAPAAARQSLSAPPQAQAGAPVAVGWSGEAGKLDFITIVEAGAKEGTYKAYEYPSKRTSPLTLRAPEQPGAYEIRWLAGASPYATLARAPLVVVGADASLEAPATVAPGAKFQVRWSGPDNDLDYIVLVPAGDDAAPHREYEYTQRGNPATLVAPETAGAYEVRYVTGREKLTLARVAVSVGAASASVSPPASVAVGSTFEVPWTGPGNDLDYVSVTTLGDPGHDVSYAYTKRGNPARIEAPKAAGRHAVHYVTGRERHRLATVEIDVVGAPPPGRLTVLVEGATGLRPGNAVEVVLDASGSMLQRLDGRRRIEIARDALTRLVGEVLPDGTPFALRVFGHRESDSCRTDLEIPLAPLDRAKALAAIAAIDAKNLAKTPIGRSLELVRDDLAAATGERVVVLVTDGEETCDGDPGRAIESLRAASTDVRVTIVGFAIDEFGLRRTFETWARAGGGAYVDAPSADRLVAGLGEAVRVPFTVRDSQGVAVAAGVVGGEALSLPPGRYVVGAEQGGRSLSGEVEIHSGQEHSIRLE